MSLPETASVYPSCNLKRMVNISQPPKGILQRHLIGIHSTMIGRKIREYRLAMGFKLKEFAPLIGISQGALSDIENEKTKPSADTVIAIIRTTEINPWWLLVDQGEMFDRRRGDTSDPMTRKVLDLLSRLDEASKKDILKYVEDKELLARLRDANPP